MLEIEIIFMTLLVQRRYVTLLVMKMADVDKHCGTSGDFWRWICSAFVL